MSDNFRTDNSNNDMAKWLSVSILLFIGICSYCQDKKESEHDPLKRKIVILQEKGLYDSAVYYLHQSIESSKSQQDWDKYIDGIIRLTQFHIDVNDFKASNTIFSESQKLLDSIQNVPIKTYSRFIQSYHKFCLIRNDMKVVEKLYLGLLKKTKKALPSFVRDSLIQEAYEGLGYNYFEIERLDESLIYLDSSRLIAERVYGTKHLKSVRVSSLIATVYMYMGDYSSAHSILARSHKIIESDQKTLSSQYMESYLKLGQAKTLMSENTIELEEAILLMKEGLRKARLSSMELFNYYNDNFERELAKTFLKLGKPDSALKHIELSETHWDKHYAPLYGPQAFILFEKSKIYKELSNYSEALETLQIANEIFQKAKSLALADNYLLQGDIYTNIESFSRADSCYNLALKILLPGDDLSMKTILKPDESLFLAFQKKAELNRKLYNMRGQLADLKKSHRYYKMTLRYINNVRKQFVNHYSKINLSARSKFIYSDALEVALELYSKTGGITYLIEAFLIADMNKHNALLENIKDQKLNIDFSVPEKIRANESQLLNEIYTTRGRYYQLKLNEQPKQSQLDSLANVIDLARSDLEAILRNLELNYPRYYYLKYSSDTLDFESFQKTLRGDELLLQYFVSDSSLYTFFVTRDQISYTQKKWTYVWQEKIANLTNKKDSFNRELSSEVYEFLLAGILTKHPDKTRLTILPHNVLNILPFELLVTSKGQEAIQYLVEKYIVSYQFSGYVMVNQNYTERKYSKDWVGFAPQIQSGLNRLPWAKKEVENLKEIWDGDSFVGNKATKEAFFMSSRHYKMMHVATHGFICNEEPLLSKLYFSPTDSKLEHEDVLFGYELYNHSMNTDLITLSACETGMGKILEGEGIMSLGHGFSYAGVPNIIMSLWEVSDQSTMDMMTYFYEELKGGMDYAKALRMAKIRYLQNSDKNTSNPFYWSSFVYYGRSNEFKDPGKTLPCFVYIVFLILLVLIILYLTKNFDRVDGFLTTLNQK